MSKAEGYIFIIIINLLVTLLGSPLPRGWTFTLSNPHSGQSSGYSKPFASGLL
jgi:hypothetical protein